MEAIIARCLDSAPDKRPSARELVEFMVQLPQQISLSGPGADGGSTELSSSEAHTHLMRFKPHPCAALVAQLHAPALYLGARAGWLCDAWGPYVS